MIEMITSITPNFDETLLVEKQDEHREKMRYPVVLFCAMVDPQRGLTSIAPVYFDEKQGALVIGGDRLVRVKRENNGS